MDQFRFLPLIKRQWLLIVILVAIIFSTAMVSNRQKPPQYTGSFTATVQASRTYPTTNQLVLQPAQTQDLQGALVTVQSWIADPFYVKKTLANAGVSEEGSLDDLGKVFTVIAKSPLSSTFQVQYTAGSEEDVQAALKSLTNVLEEARVNYNKQGGELVILASYTDTTVAPAAEKIPLVPIVGLVGGFVFALAVAAVVDRPRRS